MIYHNNRRKAVANRRRKRPAKKLSRKMKTKLIVLFGIIIVGLVVLIGRLMYIQYSDGEKYEKRVLYSHMTVLHFLFNVATL